MSTQISAARLLVAAVATFYNVPLKEVYSVRKYARIAHPRAVAMYFLRKSMALTYEDIGMFFKRDHSTVIAAVQKIEKLVARKDEITVADFEILAPKLGLAEVLKRKSVTAPAFLIIREVPRA
jgi:chromosomal replication initiation ATPase DnaA